MFRILRRLELRRSLSDSVRELCDGCFKGCSSLQRVTFGPSSSLERIGVEAFGPVQVGTKSTPCGLEEIRIPDGVRELCDRCFKWCENLCRVTFGPSSSLEVISDSCFRYSGLSEVSMPERVYQLCDCCLNYRDCHYCDYDGSCWTIRW